MIKKTEEDCIYALVGALNLVPGDVYIDMELCSKVEILEKILFNSAEADYGEHEVRLYFIKITLDYGEMFPMYYAFEDAEILDKHDVVFKANWSPYSYEVTRFLKTQINFSDERYVSLGKV